MTDNLSKEQMEVFEYIKSGKNVFITGPGGTGKTFLIQNIYKWFKYNERKNIQVTALTGCAAVLLKCNAKTLHSWAGIGLGNGPIEDVINRVSFNKFKRKNWLSIDILVIDEVSMLSSKLLSILDGIAKRIRNNTLPFGGIQLVFSGDFYQLPPVGNKSDIGSTEYCFENPIWNTLFEKQIQLKKIYRQSDEVFCNILNEIRIGKLSRKNYDILKSRCIPSTDADDIKPVRLLARRNDVSIINDKEMMTLDGEYKDFNMEIIKTLPDNKRNKSISESQLKIELDTLKNNIIAEENLTLKIGAQVMCIVNIDIDGETPLVNGSCGIVTGFNDVGLPIVKFNNGIIRTINYHIWELEDSLELKKGYGIKQIPLILSWAITIHKSQGCTFDKMELNLSGGLFLSSQLYVGLSRVRSLNGLYLLNILRLSVNKNEKVDSYYARLE
jgi:ATP-dependent DNA helicase PIF1